MVALKQHAFQKPLKIKNPQQHTLTPPTTDDYGPDKTKEYLLGAFEGRHSAHKQLVINTYIEVSRIMGTEGHGKVGAKKREGRVANYPALFLFRLQVFFFSSNLALGLG